MQSLKPDTIFHFCLENRVGSRKYEHQDSSWVVGGFFAEALKEVPTLFQPEVNSNSDIKTKRRYLEQPFSSPFFFSEAVAFMATSSAGFWLSVETYHKDLAAMLLYMCDTCMLYSHQHCM